MDTTNSLQPYAGLIGSIALAVVLSLIVALLARKNVLGYGKAFIICLIAGIVFILLSVPFDILISSGICVIVYLFLPKKKPNPEVKQ